MKTRFTRNDLCCGHLWYSLVALLIPGLPVHSVAGHLPAVWHILPNLLGSCVAVPLTPLTVGLRCEAHRVLLTYKFVFQEEAEYHVAPQ